MEIDRRLHEAGQRWRESQEPALQPPSAASLGAAAPPHQWRKGLAPMAAAAAVAAIVFGFVSVHGATTGAPQLPAGSVTTPAPSVSTSSAEPSTSAARTAAKAAAAKEEARAVAAAEAARRLQTLTWPPAADCVASQLRPSLGSAGAAAGTGIVQILLQNVSSERCYLGGLLPLQGVTASGTSSRLTFPGDSATAYPSPVVPGNVAPGGFGAFWVSTQLNGCANGARFAQLVIELSPQQYFEMPWPIDMSSGCLFAESAAGPFLQPIPSIP